MQYLTFILALIIGYLLGSIPLAYLLVKWTKGVDLRKCGSGNVGFTNVAATASKWLSVPVFLFDIGKGVLAVYIARWLGLPLYMQGLVGIAAVIGHNWPVFLNFSAGRGILTIVGVGLAFEPRLAGLLTVLSFAGIPFHILSITALVCIFLLPVLIWFSYVPGMSWLIDAPLGDDRIILSLIFLVMWLVLVIRRLSIPLSPLAQDLSKGKILFNRFLFDRDIRDRRVWLTRGRPGSHNQEAKN